MIHRSKIKKMADLWNTFRLHQRQSIDSYGGPLGNALNNVWWTGYITGLYEFGILKEKDADDCIKWCPL
jgi:hypothetical protein